MSTAQTIAEALTGQRLRARKNGYLVCCPAHEDSTPSLSIADGETDILVHCFAGCTAADIFAAIRQKHGGLLNGSTMQAPLTPAKDSDEYKRQQHDKAARLWSQRRPIVGTPAEAYLRRRGITCALPATLGFLPSRKPERHPALIAAFALVLDEPEPGILGRPRDVQSVHLTLLKPDGGKAEVPKPKLMVGSPGDAPIVLAPSNDLLGLAITEGIEDALTVHEATGLGVWAAAAAGRMPKLAPLMPSYIEAAIIYAHDDAAGRDGGQFLAEALAHRIRKEKKLADELNRKRAAEHALIPFNAEIRIEGLSS